MKWTSLILTTSCECVFPYQHSTTHPHLTHVIQHEVQGENLNIVTTEMMELRWDLGASLRSVRNMGSPQ